MTRKIISLMSSAVKGLSRYRLPKIRPEVAGHIFVGLLVHLVFELTSSLMHGAMNYLI